MSQLKIKNGNSWESVSANGMGVPSGGLLPTSGYTGSSTATTDCCILHYIYGIKL